MMIFMDESGRTGTQKYDVKWNFKSQPYFVLCGLGIPYDRYINVGCKIETVLHDNGIHEELKSTNKSHKKKKNKLISEFNTVFKENHCKIFVEVVNKKFLVARHITDYCVFPYYDSDEEIYASEESKLIRKSFANYIYRNVDDLLLGKFVELFDSNMKSKEQLITLNSELCSIIRNEDVKKYIKETIDSIKKHEDLKLTINHIFPLVDYNKGGFSTVAVSPHIDSLNGILVRASKIQNTFQIIHDNQPELSEAFPKVIDEFNRLRETDVKFCFEDSKKSRFIQCADFISGNIRSEIESKLIRESYDKTESLQRIIQNDTIFISTFEEQMRLFPYNNDLIKFNKWYIEGFES